MLLSYFQQAMEYKSVNTMQTMAIFKTLLLNQSVGKRVKELPAVV
jgi:hypothetical protein